MSHDQHNAGIHYIRHDPTQAIGEDEGKKIKLVEPKCPDCKWSSVKLEENGQRFVCVHCGKAYPIKKETNLAKFKEKSSQQAIDNAYKFRQKLWGKKASDKLCPVCDMTLMEDDYCPICQKWRR